MDDDVILPGDIPVPEYYPNGNDTEDLVASDVVFHEEAWPTPSGITEQQARDACQRTLESYAAYNICREYVDLEQLIAMCALNVQVRDCFVYCGLYKVAQIKQHYEYCSDFLAKHTNSVKQTKFIQKQYSTCHGVNSSPFPHLVWKSFQDTTQTPNFSSTIKRPITKTYLVR